MKRVAILLGITATLMPFLCQPTVADEDAMQARLQRVFAKLSPPCQQEIQQVYAEGNSEVSDPCKAEYQQGMTADVQEYPPSQQEAEALQQAAQAGANDNSGQGQGQGQGQKKGKAKRDLNEEPDPTPYIIGFVVVFLSSIAGYVYYANEQVPPPKKRKKLSKKKEMKKKRQEQNIMGK